MHDVFYVSLLKPYRGDPTRAPEPGPILLDNKEEWRIDTILNHKTSKQGETHYNVRWLGWPDSENI